MKNILIKRHAELGSASLNFKKIPNPSVDGRNDVSSDMKIKLTHANLIFKKYKWITY